MTRKPKKPKMTECTACKGQGWFVDFQARKTCKECEGGGKVPVSVPIKSTKENVGTGIPTVIEPDDTEPIFFPPDFDIPDLYDDDDDEGAV